jgi:hypothetical protein
MKLFKKRLFVRINSDTVEQFNPFDLAHWFFVKDGAMMISTTDAVEAHRGQTNF